MPTRIPDETLQAIRDRLSIVELVSGYTALKKAGKSYLGLCPFHGEKTPSFTVSEERGLFHCFGCGAGGSIFNFVMRADHVAFPEAVEILARRAGVQIARSGDKDTAERDQLLSLNEFAQRWFRSAFAAPQGSAARQYLAARGIEAETAERYGLGFCPPGGDLARAASTRKLSFERLGRLGLVGKRANGTYYDYFWGRITFPIRDGSGRILGFGGRTLGSGHPKYLNSPESPAFHKAHVLYGLYEAREAVRAAERIVIVEGYLDAIALAQSGIGNCVASLGTALGVSQLRLARRFAPEVMVFFDGDRAGQEAAMRAFAACAEADVWGLGAFLPDGFDPDTFVRKHGVEATRELLASSVPLADYFVDRCDPGPTASVPARARAVEKVGAAICLVRDPVKSNLLARRAADRLGVDPEVLRDVRSAPRRSAAASMPTRETNAVNDEEKPFRPEELALVEAMALEPRAAAIVRERGVLECFESKDLAEAGRRFLEACESGQATESVVDSLPPRLAELISAALVGEGAAVTGDRLQIVVDCIDRIARRQWQVRAREHQARLRRAELTGDPARLNAELQRANEALRNRRADLKG